MPKHVDHSRKRDGKYFRPHNKPAGPRAIQSSMNRNPAGTRKLLDTIRSLTVIDIR